MASAASVGARPWPERTSSGSPVSSRSRFSWALTIGCVLCRRIAARETLRSLITVCKTFTRWRSILAMIGRCAIRWIIYLLSRYRVYLLCRQALVFGTVSAARASMDTRPIRFVHRGRIVSVDGAAPTRSVLEWLREDARCTGTKEGCAEGDCGACTVIVAELADSGAASGAPAAQATVVGGLSLRPVNACIRFLPTLDGKALLSVEDLAAAGGELHPVQQAMVECHGSQCGFCTPGFVMTMAACYEHHCEAGTVPTRAAAGRRAVGQPVPLHRLPADPRCRAAHVRAAGARAWTPRRSSRCCSSCAPTRRCTTWRRTRRGARRPAASGPLLRAAHAGRAGRAARRAAAGAAAGRLHRHRPVGQQDVPRPGRHRLRRRGRRTEAHRREADGALHIGAGAALEDAWSALAARWPALNEAWLRFAGPPVRHAGTMGGNVANGSPIGDSAPVLIALGARIVLRHGTATREMLLEDFYLDYMKNQLVPGEFVAGHRACRCPRRRSACAPTRSASATTATSRRCSPAWRSSSTATS